MHAFLGIGHVGTRGLCVIVCEPLFPHRHHHATLVGFVDDGLLCHSHCSHGCGQQHSVLMGQGIGQIQESQFTVYGRQQLYVLPVVFYEGPPVLVIELVQRAFKRCF